MDIVKQFEENKYVHLKDFYNKDECRQLTEHLHQIVLNKETYKDSQCPLSDAVFGDKVFDQLLENLVPYFEKASGKKLYPTYSYARLYRPGEELKIHTDRPACEISATLTLGWSGKQWAIYMADKDSNGEAQPIDIYEDKSDPYKLKNVTPIYMNVGDAVLYRGMEKVHWREKFEGEWQAQVFLHYVDAEGPHADQKYDGRASLGIKKESTNPLETPTILPEFTYFTNHFGNEYCENLIKTYTTSNLDYKEPIVGDGFTARVDTNIRDVKRYVLPSNQGIGGILTATGLNANNYWWKYNVTHSNQTEFLIYEPGGHYVGHTDVAHAHDKNTRKLTVLAFLNDDYEGGKFWINATGKKDYPVQTKGTVLVFPSYMVHGVEPVTKGVRYSCVTWLLGDYFK